MVQDLRALIQTSGLADVYTLLRQIEAAEGGRRSSEAAEAKGKNIHKNPC